MQALTIAATFGDTAFDVLKSVHVLAAALWVGGNFVLNLAANMAFASRDPRNQSLALHTAAFIGQRIFTPLALLVVAAGTWLVLRYDNVFDFGDFWVSYGFGVFILTFLVGVAFLGPQSAKVAGLIDAGADQDTVRASARPFRIVAILDLLVLWSVVVVMVVKPT